uniref:Ldh family oxidoreductase n=2 Tax=Enterobacter TaxID=547 RepID=UPI0034D252A5
PPFIFDMATSAAARGEIQLHQRAGKPIPEGWGIDSDGQPTTDPQAVLDGAMLTFGGHKGSALAAMVELFAGPLIGDMTSAESLAWDNGAGGLPYGGELILALDPQRFLGAEAGTHLARAETLFSGMQAQGARLPGERRYLARERSELHGLDVSRGLYDEICALRG